jgi:murein DD-endopeptidase MepM/ murein hydrolase activator NlpD
LLVSCTIYGPYRITQWNPYGARTVAYGDGRHPGVDFDVPTATPVISVADGDVILVTHSSFGGLIVRVSHGEHFDSWYAHLSEVSVQLGQSLKRGQLIGVSGADYTRREYLHFGICRKLGSCTFFPDTHDPAKYWLGGTPQCFDPNTDYSRHPQTDITVPLACGDYARALIARVKGKDRK